MGARRLIIRGGRNVQLEVDGLFHSIRQLKKSLHYEHQYRILVQLKDRAVMLFDGFEHPPASNTVYTPAYDIRISAPQNSTSYYFSLMRKIRLLQHLQIIAGNLQEHWTEALEENYTRYAAELNKMLDSADYEIINKTPFNVFIFGYEENEEFKRLSNRLRSILNKKFARIRRDLRVFIRRIKRFFLLSLDDESDAVAVATAEIALASSASPFIHHLSHLKWKKKNYWTS